MPETETQQQTPSADAPTTRTATPSYYTQIGGAPAVKTAVGLFYDRVLSDAELAGYFTGVQMAEQRRHMVLMLTAVLGGPDNYRGRSLAEAHQPLRIPPAHYALVCSHLIATLTQLGAAAEILDHVRLVLTQVEHQVVYDGRHVGSAPGQPR